MKCACIRCNSLMRGCHLCRQDELISGCVIEECDISKCEHMKCPVSVEKLIIQQKVQIRYSLREWIQTKLKRDREKYKDKECRYCGNHNFQEAGNDDDRFLICNICNTTLEINRNNITISKHILMRAEQDDVPYIERKKIDKKEIKRGFKPIKSKITGTDNFALGDWGNIEKLKKGEKITNY